MLGYGCKRLKCLDLARNIHPLTSNGTETVENTALNQFLSKKIQFNQSNYPKLAS